MKHLDLDSICKEGDWFTWKEFFTARKITGEKLKLLMDIKINKQKRLNIGGVENNI